MKDNNLGLVQGLEIKIIDLKETINDLKETINDLELDINSRDNEISDLELENNDLTHKIDELELELDEIKEEIHILNVNEQRLFDIDILENRYKFEAFLEYHNNYKSLEFEKLLKNGITK